MKEELRQKATGHPAAMPLMVKVGLVSSFGATHAHLGREIISQKANGCRGVQGGALCTLLWLG